MTETLLWEAWEDYDAISQCKTIYVLGEVGDKKLIPFLRKKELPGLPPNNLVLEIIYSTSVCKNKVQEVMYAQEICNTHYDVITIFYGHKVIAEITDLEKVTIS